MGPGVRRDDDSWALLAPKQMRRVPFSTTIRHLVGAQAAPPAAHAVLAFHQSPISAASEDAFRAAVGVERSAELAHGLRPLRVGEGRLEQSPHARAAVGIVGAD